jgi:hypothetical protein
MDQNEGDGLIFCESDSQTNKVLNSESKLVLVVYVWVWLEQTQSPLSCCGVFFAIL